MVAGRRDNRALTIQAHDLSRFSVCERKGAVAVHPRDGFFCFEGESAVADTADKESLAETLSKEAQLDKPPPALNRRSSRVAAVVVSLLALVVVGAASAAYALPHFNVPLPNLSGLAELFPHETASDPKPDPISVALKDVRSVQDQNAAALQENTVVLQQSAATLDSLRQGFIAQQTDLKKISSQLSSLIERVDSLQNAVTPLTTSAISRPNARSRVAPSKKISRAPKFFGPISVGGAPLGPPPG